MRTGLLVVLPLLALPAAARDHHGGSSTTNVLASCAATDAPGRYSVLRIVVSEKNRREDWPDGCVLRLTAEPGLTLVVRVEDRNVRKYRVLFDEKVEKSPDLGTIPADFARYLGIGNPSPGAAADNKGRSLASVLDDLKTFHDLNARLGAVASALKNAHEDMATAEDYPGLIEAVLKELVGKHPYFDGCRAGGTGCAQVLLELSRKLEPDLQALAAARTAILEASRFPDASLESKYVAEIVAAKYDAARKVAEGIPALAKEIAGLFNSADTKASLFARQQTFEFRGDPLTVRVRVEGGDEKSPATVYGFEVRLEPEKTAHFAFSTGFMFTNVVDRTYAVRDGKIKEKGDTDSVHAGVGILAHWLFSGRGWAVSAGLLGTDANVQYLVGGSYLWGEKQRFVLSIGGAVGSAQRLDKVSVDDPFTESTVPTKKVTRAGGFAGVSFKF